MNMKKLTLISAAILTAAFTASSQAQTTTVVIDEDYVANGTASSAVSFFGSSGSNAIETNTDSFGLVSGTSGRTIHALFPTQTLAGVGDIVTVSTTFLTPTTVGLTNEEFRIGLFDHLGRTGADELGQNTSFSSTSPEPLYNDIPGFYATVDIESNDPATDLDVRRNLIESTGQSGTFLATSGNFDAIGSSSPDAGYAISPNTSYTINFMVERIADADADGVDDLSVTTQLLEGSTLLSEITITDEGVDADGLEQSIGSFDIGMFAAQAGSNAAGASSSAGAAGDAAADNDNGIDFTSFSVSLFDADGVDGGPAAPADETCYVIPNLNGGSSTVCL